MLEFAEVELEVFGIFEDLGSDEELENAKSLLFKKRATSAIDLLNRMHLKPDILKPIVRTLNELIKLGEEVRNLIAHNPLDLSLESVLAGGSEHEIRSFRNYEKVITFQELQKSYANLVSCRDSLFHSMYKVRVIDTNKRNA